MNKRTGSMLFALIVLVGVLLGCNTLAPVKTLLSAETHTSTALPPTDTETPIPQPSATLTPTIIPTKTKRTWKPTASHSVTLCPSSTPTATPTPISPEAQAFKEFLFSNCIPVEESLPEGFEIPWNLLVGGQIIDLENGVTTETFLSRENIPEDTDLNPYYIHVSPDGKWVAYQDTSHKKLYLEPIPTSLTNNEAVDRIVIEKDVRFHLQRWVDNETVFYIYRESMETYIFPTVFQNVFSGEEYEFSLQDLPDYMAHHWGGAVIATHYLDGEVIPDPTMRMIVYPEMSDEPGVYATNTLWDLVNKRPLARLRHLLIDFTGPLWAQDGSNLLIMGPNPEMRRYIHVEWFFIDTNGNIRQLTYFQDIFLDDSYSISNASRSKDARYLAFEFHESTSRSEGVTRTIVLDLNTNPLDGFCIEAPVRVNSFRGSKWSPDSKFFTLSNVDMYNEGDIIMVDVENEAAYIVGQDMRVIGWIAKPEGEK